MSVFLHHIYEYKKGLRNLVLYTAPGDEEQAIRARLLSQQITCHISQLDSGRINVFFGNSSCVETVRSFGDKKLNHFTPEEDFILGIMLGYDRLAQCGRYLQRKAIG